MVTGTTLRDRAKNIAEECLSGTRNTWLRVQYDNGFDIILVPAGDQLFYIHPIKIEESGARNLVDHPKCINKEAVQILFEELDKLRATK